MGEKELAHFRSLAASEDERLRNAVLDFFYYPLARDNLPIKRYSLDELSSEKSALKRDIFDFNTKWSAVHGKKPSAKEKLPLRALYYRYNKIKAFRAKLQRKSQRATKRASRV